MNALKWIIIALAMFQGGWMTFDGGRAFIVGDYVTSASGPRAGQLGPWSRIVSAIGLKPRGTVVRLAHVVVGLAWLVSAVIFALKPASGWWAVFACAMASLWYLPVGTLLSLVQLGLLLTPYIRKLE